MVVALLYAMQSPYDDGDSLRSIRLARRQRCYDGDQGVTPVTMVIMTVLRRWRSKAQDDIGHITSLYDLHVMFIMFTSYLLRTTVA